MVHRGRGCNVNRWGRGRLMKKIIIFLTVVLLSPLTCHASWWSASRSPISGGFLETFDASGYDNAGWTTVSGTPNPDCSTSPCPGVGSQSLYTVYGARVSSPITNVSGSITYDFLVYLSTDSASGTNWFWILNSSAVVIARLENRADGSLRLYHGTASKVNTTVITKAVWMHVWVEYTPGTGSNGILRVYATEYLGGEEVKPSSVLNELINGTATDNADKFRLGNYEIPGSSFTIYDNLRWYTTP